jgi:hypothetical protein
MTLKTTTWKDRNIPNLELTRSFAEKKGMRHPVIMNFGPGGSVYFLADRLPQGRTADLGRGDKFLRVFESFLRKTRLFRLKTNEPAEIARIFASLSPGRMLVFDREKMVVKAVEALAGTGVLGIPVVAQVKDLQYETPGSLADIVVALNIVSRTSDRKSALMNIMNAAKVGGLICINIDDPPTPAFRKLGHCLFERIG